MISSSRMKVPRFLRHRLIDARIRRLSRRRDRKLAVLAKLKMEDDARAMAIRAVEDDFERAVESYVKGT